MLSMRNPIFILIQLCNITYVESSKLKGLRDSQKLEAQSFGYTVKPIHRNLESQNGISEEFNLGAIVLRYALNGPKLGPTTIDYS